MLTAPDNAVPFRALDAESPPVGFVDSCRIRRRSTVVAESRHVRKQYLFVGSGLIVRPLGPNAELVGLSSAAQFSAGAAARGTRRKDEGEVGFARDLVG